MVDLKEYRTTLERKKGAVEVLSRQIDDYKKKISSLKTEINNSEHAQIIIQAVARETQKQLEYRIGELVSLAQASIFPDPWKLNLNFVIRRGQTECDFIWKTSKGNVSKKLCGGERHVGGLGLRFAIWSLEKPRTRATFFLDEPLTALKGDDLPERGGRMIKEISSGINLQMIIITHIPDQTTGADKIFRVKKTNGVSEVLEL
jgi:DNA repair exonuclease SbcCD ATPase subunit